MPPSRPSNRAALLSDLAPAQFGNLDAAAGLLGSAWDIASTTSHDERRRRIRGIRRRDIGRWAAEPSTRRIDELLGGPGRRFLLRPVGRVRALSLRWARRLGLLDLRDRLQ